MPRDKNLRNITVGMLCSKGIKKLRERINLYMLNKQSKRTTETRDENKNIHKSHLKNVSPFSDFSCIGQKQP